MRKKSTFPLDGAPVAIGLACLLRQFHPAATRQLISYLGQFIRTTIQHTLQDAENPTNKAPLEIPREVVNTLIFLNQLCHYTSVPREAVYAFVPPYIFDAIKFTPAGKA